MVEEDEEEAHDHQNIETASGSDDSEGEDASEGEDELPSTSTFEHQARGRGRPRIIRTGSRGRPKKQYRADTVSLIQRVEATEETFISEIPMKEAMTSPDANEWHQAIVDEMKSILKNDTWVLVNRPGQGRVIGCRMVLRNKLNSDSTVEKRKARLVAQGCGQQPGIHFSETFAPVARFSSIRLMASIAARYNKKIRQFDIATAYLNGDLEEEVHMVVPKSFDKILQSVIDSEGNSVIGRKAIDILREFRTGNKVCLLRKSLYGLRQAGRSWHFELDQVLRSCGATPTNSDPCLFQIGSGEDVTMIATYVDDILIASTHVKRISNHGKLLVEEFEIKDLGEASYCLGIEFT